MREMKLHDMSTLAFILGAVVWTSCGTSAVTSVSDRRSTKEHFSGILSTEESPADAAWRRLKLPSVMYEKLQGNEGDLTGWLTAEMIPESRPKRQQRQQREEELVTVELDDTSTLRALPGGTAQVRLRFISQRNVGVALYITVADTHNFVTPGVRRVYVGQQEVETLSISVTVPGDTPLGTLDLITISSAETQYFKGINATIYFYVTEEVVDTSQPSVSHRIIKNCDGALEPTTCSYKNWTFEATIKDDSSGIRKITTQPIKLQTSDHLVMGIRGTTTYQYTVSCCINEVEVIVTDIAANVVRHKINVSGFTLGTGEIIAIVLGVIIIILLIALIIVCVHQKKKSHSFPMSRD